MAQQLVSLPSHAHQEFYQTPEGFTDRWRACSAPSTTGSTRSLTMHQCGRPCGRRHGVTMLGSGDVGDHMGDHAGVGRCGKARGRRHGRPPVTGHSWPINSSLLSKLNLGDHVLSCDQTTQQKTTCTWSTDACLVRVRGRKQASFMRATRILGSRPHLSTRQGPLPARAGSRSGARGRGHPWQSDAASDLPRTK
jgi:hypothetical protein